MALAADYLFTLNRGKIMALTARQIVDGLAADEATFNADPERYLGFVRKTTKHRVDFFWKNAAPGKCAEMTINTHGVVCSRTVLNGRNWYGYTLDPFGPDVSMLETDAAARLIRNRYRRPLTAPSMGED